MTSAVGFLAAALSISLVWPQVWLSCRHRRTGGLSPLAGWLGVSLNVCWLAFGVLTNDTVQIATNAVVGIGNAAVLTALLVTQPQVRRRPVLVRTASAPVALAALATAGCGAVALGVPAAAVSAVLGAGISLVAAGAACVQPWALLRDRTQDLSGLSETRWRLAVVSSALWVSYGLMREQPAVFLSAGIGLACAVVVCGILVRRSARPVRPVVGLRWAVAA